MTTTTTVTIPPAPPRSPPPPSLQMPTRRRACHNVTATKCHRNCFSTAGGAGYGIGGGIGDDNETMAMAATVTGEQTPPTKRNWVLSDNFYLLESPKTWRDKQRTRTANRRQYFQCNGGGGGLSDTVDNVNCDEKLLSRIASDHQMKRRYCQQLQTATSINCHGLNRSLRNLLDYREEEAEKTSVSSSRIGVEWSSSLGKQELFGRRVLQRCTGRFGENRIWQQLGLAVLLVKLFLKRRRDVRIR